MNRVFNLFVKTVVAANHGFMFARDFKKEVKTIYNEEKAKLNLQTEDELYPIPKNRSAAARPEHPLRDEPEMPPEVLLQNIHQIRDLFGEDTPENFKSGLDLLGGVLEASLGETSDVKASDAEGSLKKSASKKATAKVSAVEVGTLEIDPKPPAASPLHGEEKL
jgi:hypothetical protein